MDRLCVVALLLVITQCTGLLLFEKYTNVTLFVSSLLQGISFTMYGVDLEHSMRGPFLHSE